MLLHQIKRIKTAGIIPVALRAFGTVGGRLFGKFERRYAGKNGTYLTQIEIDATAFPVFFMQPVAESICSDDRTVIRSLVAQHEAHRFDLLGSGWVSICKGMRPEGLNGIQFEPQVKEPSHPFVVNQSSRVESERIWNLISNPDYQPIHWHIAYRSGYEWSADLWRSDARRGLPRGVDIKEPWELSRMQHLVLMAVHATLESDGAEATVREIESQILDFIANNPPAFGVNWACTMDVAMRACSWLISFDLCRTSGGEFSEGFLKVFGRSIYEHAHFISRHLEWSDLTRGNHYLLDIIGLLFCSAYLPQTKQTDEWFGFASREFLREIDRQFNSDGSNIECSTAYHCFVSEAVVYALSLLVAVTGERGEVKVRVAHEGWAGFLAKRVGWVWGGNASLYENDRVSGNAVAPSLSAQLTKMKCFINDISRTDGSIVNIGDNDSGVFVKLGNTYAELPASGHEDLQDLHRGHVANLIHDFLHGTASTWVSGILPSRLSVPEHGGEIYSGEKESVVKDSSSEPAFSRTVSIPCEDSIWRCQYYSQFGLWILRNDVVHVSVRTKASPGQVISHAHRDELSVSVSVGADNLIEDPGIPFYTPFPDIAANYRSKAAHFAPEGVGAADLDAMEINWSSQGILIFSLGKTLLCIKRSAGCIAIASDYPLPELNNNQFVGIPVSPGYGKLREDAYDK